MTYTKKMSVEKFCKRYPCDHFKFRDMYDRLLNTHREVIWFKQDAVIGWIYHLFENESGSVIFEYFVFAKKDIDDKKVWRKAFPKKYNKWKVCVPDSKEWKESTWDWYLVQNIIRPSGPTEIIKIVK